MQSAIVSVLVTVTIYSHSGAFQQIETISEKEIVQIIQRADEVLCGRQSD